ncbi:hypothetical protein Nepgr_009982 [Nepenthes gracilis]|uniref:Protein EARLY RESPONSIVE TO DEHYDRATION 15 n=1 Tax=Nepenthes gracilis TaxID=150966 RepID=A0AAD3XKM8_NEPGR|nr:hypothetical protein Nepgr_009982 [Nepenthes gracilis]
MHAICIRVFGPKETRYFSSPPALLRFKLPGIAQANLLVYMMRMALVSRGSSRLNPDAPLFIPAALRRVEDFSPAWWELINTSMWFRDYWLSQHQEEADIFHGNDEDNLDDVDIADLLPSDVDIVDLLPDDIYLGVEDDVLNMESQLEEFIPSQGNRESSILPKTGSEQAMEPANYQEKPTGFASSEAAP